MQEAVKNIRKRAEDRNFSQATVRRTGRHLKRNVVALCRYADIGVYRYSVRRLTLFYP
jgi:hypothetical protein